MSKWLFLPFSSQYQRTMIHKGSLVEGREGLKGHQLAQGGTWDTLKLQPGAGLYSRDVLVTVHGSSFATWREAQSFLLPSQSLGKHHPALLTLQNTESQSDVQQNISMIWWGTLLEAGWSTREVAGWAPAERSGLQAGALRGLTRPNRSCLTSASSGRKRRRSGLRLRELQETIQNKDAVWFWLISQAVRCLNPKYEGKENGGNWNFKNSHRGKKKIKTNSTCHYNADFEFL